MPSRTYGNTNLTNFTEVNAPIEQAQTSISGTNLHQIVTGGGDDLVSLLCANILYSVRLNFTAFPSIPASATITRVEISLDVIGSTSGADPGTYFLLAGLYGADLDVFNPLGIALATDTIPVSLNETLSVDDTTGYTRTQLINKYGHFGILLSARAIAAGACVTNLEVTNFTVTVTYDLENYSWYIKPTTVIVNGRPVKIIKNSSIDVAAVPEGEDPPSDEYIFYGTGEDYPDGPEYVWWTSVDFWYFFIFSPIDPTVIGPYYAPWTEVVGVPTCSGCLTLELGSLEVLVADASGVYTLSSNKTNDTLYNRDEEDTIDTKIPNPFIKTGFVP